MPRPDQSPPQIASRAVVESSTIAQIEKQVSAITNSLKEIRRGASAPSDVLVRALQTVSAKLEVLAGLKESVQREVDEIARRDEMEFLQLEANLRDAASQRDWRVEGQWPALYIQRGIDLTVNEST